MLKVGDVLPDVTVWTAPNEQRTIGELAADGPILLVFYLFDWSST
jgi:peroxiredoxin